MILHGFTPFRLGYPFAWQSIFKIILKKLVAYWHSKRAGVIEEIFGFKTPRVLTLTISQDRINNMLAANREVDPRGKGVRMFYFAEAKTFSLQEPTKIFKKVWQNGREEASSLID